MAHRPDAEIIATTHNTARFFTENRQISWVALLIVIAWGIYGYQKMPKRKDPDIPVKEAQVICAWPGVSADRVEQLVTRKIEQKLAEVSEVRAPSAEEYSIKSLTLDGLSVVNVQVDYNVKDTKPVFNEMDLKLRSITDLPKGAGPIQFFSGFGDTAALMLTVASPKESEVAISLRAREIAAAIRAVRSAGGDSSKRATIVVAFPQGLDSPNIGESLRGTLGPCLAKGGTLGDIRPITGRGFVGLDGVANSDDELQRAFMGCVEEKYGSASFDPDIWQPVVVRNPDDAQARLETVAGDKYSYRELDDFTDLIRRGLTGVPQVSKILISGDLPQWINLEYSQSTLAAYGITPGKISQVLAARNIVAPGGSIETNGRNLIVLPSGEFKNEKDIGDTIIGKSATGSPLYLRDLVTITRGYQDPARYLNTYTIRDAGDAWQTHRAITIAVQMRSGEQIHLFGENVDHQLALLRQQLPSDLIMARTSDQPRQVEENVQLLNHALEEAIVLVVITALIGFWEWRSALLMAVSIPLTLLMTFGFMDLVGWDIQQVSIASLIIALGLLIDDPVVAGDAIKRDLDSGHPRIVSAWLGPTKLARAILYATITNIVAYLPFGLLSKDTGKFMISLPVVMTASLIASRLVSMTFIPMLGYYWLRPAKKKPLPIEEQRRQGFSGYYYRTGHWCLEHRWLTLIASLVFLVVGFKLGGMLKSAFFPIDLQFLSTVDIFLPNDSALTETTAAAAKAREIIEQQAHQIDLKESEGAESTHHLLKSLTTFVGGGGPRFWYSLAPETKQVNYAQVVIEIDDRRAMSRFANILQPALSAAIPGAYVDVQELQTNGSKYPVEIFVSGRAESTTGGETEDIATLRKLADNLEDILRAVPDARRVRDDWMGQTMVARLQIDPDRANLAGVTNEDVAASTTASLSGTRVATLLDGDKQIPVVARLYRRERATVPDLENLYVYPSNGGQPVPLKAISSVKYELETQRIRRRAHYRTITVAAFTAPGVLASEVLNQALPKIKELQATVPTGYSITIGGEYAKQQTGFGELGIILLISCLMIYVALVIQFNSAIKPVLVFACVPYGVVGALLALLVMGTPFGFMAFLGIASLIGVIVSHVIVLFDFIEEMHEKGEPFMEAVLDAGIERLRPVLITVGAAVLALVPLSVRGGPLWEPLCYAQIGGLSVATFIELLLVPVFYGIFVLDLKLIKWETMHPDTAPVGVIPLRGAAED
ncbi:MAG: efflux RND transporter permease subunit [Candidatus Binatus sp.]|uniref:efflux RND transporter permease subunit n=2 Tax=Candidatus Binatus sp. TaxID=2811406 RepID=UPI003BB13B5B